MISGLAKCMNWGERVFMVSRSLITFETSCSCSTHKGGLAALMHFRENRFQLLCNAGKIIVDGHRLDVS
jgi:hypothetical protein